MTSPSTPETGPILTAAGELAETIGSTLNELREALVAAAPGDPVYGVALVITDDFSSLQLYANTASHLAEGPGGVLQKWYFGEWWSEGIEIDADPLTNHIGEVEDFDDEPETGKAPEWLAAMTEAMRIARDAGAFKFSDQQSFIFCSMVDSLNAIWLEDLSARLLNPEAEYREKAPELREATAEWYSDAEEETTELQSVYEELLARLRGD